MNRRWIQAVFCSSTCSDCLDESKVEYEENFCGKNVLKDDYSKMDSANDTEIDMSDSIAFDMFGLSQFSDETLEIDLRDRKYIIKALRKEYQHTCKSTGLMLWESARVMSMILAENPSIVSGKTVLELGCGSAGICSMVATRFASLVVSTDGDPEALKLLDDNLALNLEPVDLQKLVTRRLDWGDEELMKSILELNPHGFEVILGTDVTYIPEAICPLFKTARMLISGRGSGNSKPALILCHIVRRVHEESILLTASEFGFQLIDKWGTGVKGNSPGGIIGSWMSSDSNFYFANKLVELNTSVNILYFQS